MEPTGTLGNPAPSILLLAGRTLAFQDRGGPLQSLVPWRHSPPVLGWPSTDHTSLRGDLPVTKPCCVQPAVGLPPSPAGWRLPVNPALCSLPTSMYRMLHYGFLPPALGRGTQRGLSEGRGFPLGRILSSWQDPLHAELSGGHQGAHWPQVLPLGMFCHSPWEHQRTDLQPRRG